MEPEGSLPHSQQPATCPYPEPYQSSQCPPSHFLKIHFNIILPYMPGSFAHLLLQPIAFNSNLNVIHVCSTFHYGGTQQILFSNFLNAKIYWILKHNWCYFHPHNKLKKLKLNLSLRRAGPSSRGVLPSVMCLKIVWLWSLEKWGGLGPQGAVQPLKNKT